MRDPEPKNPNSTLPPKGSNEFIKPNRSTRNLISKPPVNTGMKFSKKVSFKAGKGNVLAKDIEGLVYDEDVSDGGGLGMKVLKEMWILVWFLILRVFIQDVMVGQLLRRSMFVKSNESGLGPMSILFEEDDILNPRKSPVTSLRILKRGETLSDDGHNANATFIFNNSKRWPKIGNSCEGSSGVQNE
nr:hypothetical protein [Tanacetum cinerariifolium]